MRVNSWHRGETLGNVNIPKGSNIFGSAVWANGDVDTYYRAKGGIYSVGSRLDDMPKKIIGHQPWLCE